MRINSRIAALRGDRAPQRQAQAEMERACKAWSKAEGVPEILREFDRYGAGDDLDTCADLQRLLTDGPFATSIVQQLADTLCRAMRENPLGHPPFRIGFDGTAATILLKRSGRAQLLLQAREPGSFDYPSVTFSHAERNEIILSGAGRATIVRDSGRDEKLAVLCDYNLALEAGTRCSLDLTREAFFIDRAETRIVSLRLLRVAERPQPTREYARESGRLLHQSAGDLATSHRESMVALLGRMGRADAAPVLAGLTLQETDISLRWQALRECLALDTAEGYAALCRIARDEADPLSADAGALRAQLCEAHPELIQLEEALCPA